jgi:hypothetical protein
MSFINVLYLFQQSKYKVINKDQWCNILEFSRLVSVDLSNYDEDGACKLYSIETHGIFHTS